MFLIVLWAIRANNTKNPSQHWALSSLTKQIQISNATKSNQSQMSPSKDKLTQTVIIAKPQTFMNSRAGREL